MKLTLLLPSQKTGAGRQEHIHLQPQAKRQGASAGVLRAAHHQNLKAPSEGSQVRGQVRTQSGLRADPELATDLTVPDAHVYGSSATPTFGSPLKGLRHLDALYKAVGNYRAPVACQGLLRYQSMRPWSLALGVQISPKQSRT